MVFQSYALFPHLTVGQNVAYGLDKAANRAGGVQEALELVQLAHLESRMPHELSGGQQQRVALARALAPKPALILLDEPFSNLDAGLRATVRAEVRDILRMAETTALFVTHDQAEALSLCDQVAVMIDGQIAQMAPPHILYQHPASKAVAAFVGDANFLPGTCQTDGQVECELGRFAVTKSLTGEVEIMLRPEAIRLTLNDQGQGVIIDRHYFGHEQVLICCLDSGTLIRVRLSGLNQHFVLGRRVDFSLTGDAVVFPR
jgi:iron(III) transport system ATP-binding protein